MPKNIQTTVQFCSFHILARLCSKSFKLGISSMRTKNFQMYKLDLEKAEEPEIKLPTSTGSSKKHENSRKTSTSALLITPKPLMCVDHNKLWKILKGMEIPDHLICLLRNLYIKKQQLELDMEQWTGSNS